MQKEFENLLVSQNLGTIVKKKEDKFYRERRIASDSPEFSPFGQKLHAELKTDEGEQGKPRKDQMGRREKQGRTV
jgi:hypothetical protein